MSFTVFKSSAGSGKTYTLVREYLKLVLKQPDSFRHVLAITFTNKAANEMKDRIVRVLMSMAEHDPGQPGGNADGGYIRGLAADTGLTEEEIVNSAGQVLKNILHNYSDFAVSTIDSFIHRIIRSFAFDLNVPVNFEVEMDTEEVLKQAVDIMISRVGSDPVLTRFLTEFVQLRAEEDKNWNIEEDLMKVARLLKRESSAAYLERNAGLGIGEYMKVHAAISKFLAAHEEKISNLAGEALSRIRAAGVPSRAFYQGDRGIYNYLRKLSRKELDAIKPNTYVLNTLEQDKWTSGNATHDEEHAIRALAPGLTSACRAILKEDEARGDDYILFREIQKTIYPLAFLGTVNQVLEEFKAENNILLISEFNQLIAGIVLDQPVPFIYERVGEKYRHFLLDEFQDTSVLQWQNLLPLLENSLAQGYGNLVVGDAKQAIYRWRNGEVEQFVSLPEIYGRKEGHVHLERELMLRQHYAGRSLDHNYRSKPGIVNFNNDFFRWMAERLPEKESLIYEGVTQEIASRDEGGFVQLEFFPPGKEDASFDEYNCTRVLDLINDVIGRGFGYHDIAILCRTNRAAAAIAKHLLTSGVQVVSTESMLLQSSPKVRLLAALMTLLVEPLDQPAAMEVVNLLHRLEKVSGSLHSLAVQALAARPGGGAAVFDFLREAGFLLDRRSLLALPPYELCETLARILGLEGEPDPFLQFFLDLVLEKEDESSSGLRKFLEYWNRKKEGLSIVVPGGLDAVSVMTIHKAKGLEFPVVIYPFVNDALIGLKDPLWMELDSPVAPGLGSVLVNSNKAVRETRYGKLLDRELERIQLDMANLLYVAFTRPTDELYVIANHPENQSKSQFSVPALLFEYVGTVETRQSGPYIYQLGAMGDATRHPGRPGNSYSLETFHSGDWRSRALISYQAPSNWEVDEPVGGQEWGNLIHRILSEIGVADDLIPVLDDYQHRGILAAQERHVMQALIREFLDRPDVRAYFRPGVRLRNEAEIIAPGGDVFRPDRIVEVANGLTVIDFKTGAPSESHRGQVRHYVDLLKGMTSKPVHGVVLYLDHHEPIHVD